MRNRNPAYMTTPGERVGYWSFFIGQNIYYNITAMFISTYLAMQGIHPAKVGTVLLIVKVWDAVNDPLFGFLFDLVKFKGSQKCLPWIRIAAVTLPIVTIAMFSIPGFLSDSGKLLWFGVTYLLWDTAYTLSDVPAYSMLNTMTSNLEERTRLLSVNRLYSGAGVLIYGVVLNWLIGEDVGMNASLAVALLCIFSAATMVPLCIGGRERNYVPDDQERFTLRQMLRYLRSNKYLRIYFCGFCIMEALRTSGAVLLFASFYLFGKSTYSILLNVLNIAPGLLAAMAMPRLLQKFDKFKLFFWCNIANIILGLGIYLAGWGNTAFFLTMTVIRCIPMSTVSILNYMFTPDCAEYGQYVTGISARGITFAVQTFSTKLTTAISSSLALFLLGLFRWTAVEAENFQELARLDIPQSEAALQGLWAVYALVPVIGMALAVFCFLRYKLNDRDVQIMASCNAGRITREEAQKRLSRNYGP